ncbi:hypothetical protein FACS1894147_12890 [Spirochaetia bacterium]|nr:hypothetical protein FACS1894147_12890 [Spirochaetia bacterium]
MPIQKTIENPASYRITVDVPREMPVGPVVLTFTPAAVREKAAVPEDARGQSNSDDFRRGLRRAYGAWEANPWENCIEDIRAMRGGMEPPRPLESRSCQTPP